MVGCRKRSIKRPPPRPGCGGIERRGLCVASTFFLVIPPGGKARATESRDSRQTNRGGGGGNGENGLGSSEKKKLCSFFRTLSFFFPFDVARRWADGKEEEEEGLPSEGGRDSLAAVVLVGKGRREIAVLFTEKRRILDPWRASYGKGRALLLQGGGA